MYDYSAKCFVSARLDKKCGMMVIKHKHMKVKITLHTVAAMWPTSTTVFVGMLLSCSAWNLLDLFKVCNAHYSLHTILILYAQL
jgi:hypothetical protein